MATRKTANGSGGNGTKTSPYWASGTTAAGAWQYIYGERYNYTNENGQIFKPTTEQIEAGFLHINGGAYYKTQPTVTGLKLIQANIRDAEATIEQANADLVGLREAEKLLTDNPAWSKLLELHNRGLL